MMPVTLAIAALYILQASAVGFCLLGSLNAAHVPALHLSPPPPPPFPFPRVYSGNCQVSLFAVSRLPEPCCTEDCHVRSICHVGKSEHWLAKQLMFTAVPVSHPCMASWSCASDMV